MSQTKAKTQVVNGMDNATIEAMKLRIAELETKLSKKGEPGRIWADTSKAVKADPKARGTIVLRGVNANPKFTTNWYLTQYVRVRENVAELDKQVMALVKADKLAYRTAEELADSTARLEALIAAAA